MQKAIAQTQILPKSFPARPTLSQGLNNIAANLTLQNIKQQINGLKANTMQIFSGLGNNLTQSASNIVGSILTRNCKQKCPPNPALNR